MGERLRAMPAGRAPFCAAAIARPAAAADARIAMAVGGTAMASAAAGVVFMSNDLRRIPDVLWASRAATRTLRFSIAASLALKLVPLVLMFTLHRSQGWTVGWSEGWTVDWSDGCLGDHKKHCVAWLRLA